MNNIICENSTLYAGGGIYCSYCSPIIKNNTFINNSATGFPGSNFGGAIMCSSLYPSVTISNNTVSDNLAFDDGGGICIMGSSPNLTVTHNIITGNSANGAGGISCYYLDYGVSISNNTINDNHTTSYGGGVGFAYSDRTLFSNNIVTENTTNGYGGGIECWDSSPSIINNTIINNRAVGRPDGYGGGIGSSYYSDPIITNTILWNNFAYTGREIFISSSSYPSSLTISYSNVNGGQTSVYVDPDCTLDWGDGMIDASPLFVNDGVSDFHITWESPCRDAGDNSAVADIYDFEGDPRFAWSGTVDMGADEFYTHLYCMGGFTPSGSIEGKLVGMPGTSPVGLFSGSGVLDPPLPTAWGNFHLQAPWLLIPLVPIPADGVLVLPATIPGTPPAPYDLPMQALIGLEADSLSNVWILEVR
jgi:parallel beta-helix repeat protein